MPLPDNCDVLFVDDEEATLRTYDMLFKRPLTRQGLDCHSLLVGWDGESDNERITAAQPGEVVEQINLLRPRLILSDMQMPGIDGLQILEGIEEVDPQWLQKRDEVLKNGKLDRQRLLFMINSAGITRQERKPPLRAAYESGNLAFVLEKTTSNIRQIMALLSKGLAEQLTAEDVTFLREQSKDAVRNLLG
ncbi:hypothetical protein HN748_03885 [Candidatus Peregrinibacteria bacterium]|jgi:CheY-like chemotaxis protein|nr:hypothetical protein [Candidatus Peregrinibacteria bacterium]MBT7484249.1 hypothetical protein [Candidatus Peregrinibacteria bacterium]MBT7703350.1 hypothetical protein [Candidatus Peregrinibacteria bacterium]